MGLRWSSHTRFLENQSLQGSDSTHGTEMPRTATAGGRFFFLVAQPASLDSYNLSLSDCAQVKPTSHPVRVWVRLSPACRHPDHAVGSQRPSSHPMYMRPLRRKENPGYLRKRPSPWQMPSRQIPQKQIRTDSTAARSPRGGPELLAQPQSPVLGRVLVQALRGSGSG